MPRPRTESTQRYRVADRMRSDLPTIDAGLTLSDAQERLHVYGVDRLVVIDEGRILGLVSRGDLDRALGSGHDPDESLHQIRRKRQWCCRPQATAENTARRMTAGGATSAIVLDDGKPVGVFAPTDHPRFGPPESPPTARPRCTRVADLVAKRGAMPSADIARLLRHMS